MVSRRELLGGIGTAVLLSSVPGRALSARPDALMLVDPEMRWALAKQDTIEYSAATLSAARHPRPKIEAPLMERMLPGLPGQPPVRTVLFDGAPGRRSRAALVWMHGGGYIVGTATISDRLQKLAMEKGWLVVSVDYRLAPETPIAGSLADNYAALRWVNDHAEALGVDRLRIAVGGASAGGGHAAMLALAARDRG